MTAPVTAQPATLTGSYVIDPTHTRLGFVARHAMVTKVRGTFEDVDGSAVLDFDDPSRSTASVTFQVASINTGNAQRDEHLRANDFFDAPTHPAGTFSSTSVRVLDDSRFEMAGDLTLKGETKPVTVAWELTGTQTDPFGNLRAGFEGTATISRKDWGINWNAALETGGVLVSDKIVLELDVSAIKQA
ncbi:MAG TPA: YceI family protein [Mycobacteriales bacterium]|nr:YceI family protein [Mycobacteriales bacterium]